MATVIEAREGPLAVIGDGDDGRVYVLVGENTALVASYVAAGADNVAKAKSWAESETAPDPSDPDSKSAKTWSGQAAADAGELNTRLNSLNISFPEQPFYIPGWSISIGMLVTDASNETIFAVDVEGRTLMNSGHSMAPLTFDGNGGITGPTGAINFVESDWFLPIEDADRNLLFRIHKRGTYAGYAEFAFPPLVAGALLGSAPAAAVANSTYVAVPFMTGSVRRFRVEVRATGRVTYTSDGLGDDTPSAITSEGMVLFTSKRGSVETQMYVPADGSAAPAPVVSSAALVPLEGDSNSSDVEGYYPQFAAIATGRTVFMAGWSRQTTPQIAARQNGIPCTITVSGDSIPGTGTATITAMSTRFLSQAGLTVAKQADVMVNGVECTIYKDAGSYTNPTTYADVYTIGRKEAGAAVAVSAGTSVYTVDGINNRVGTQIMWPGRNDGAASLLTVTKPGIAAMIGYLSPLSKHVIILGIVPAGYPATAEIYGTTPYTQIRAYNDDMLATYGDARDGTHSGRFFDVHRYLVDKANNRSQCLIDAGLTATANDLIDIANDIPPRQIVTQDTTGYHYTVAARTQIAARLYEILTAKGW